MANRAWKAANKVTIETLVYQGREIRYFRERSEKGYHTVNSLPSDQFAIDLQKLNVSNVDSVTRWIERWGVPCYGISKWLFLLSRASTEKQQRVFSVLHPEVDIEGTLNMLTLESEGFSGYPRSVPGYRAIKFFSPSEKARFAYWSQENCRKGGGIVSITEAQFCLRQFQNAFALLMAEDAFDGEAGEILEYLLTAPRRQSKKMMFERAAPLFLTSALDGELTLPTDERVTRDSEFVFHDSSEAHIAESKRRLLERASFEIKRNVAEAQLFVESVSEISTFEHLESLSSKTTDELAAMASEAGISDESSWAESISVQFADAFESDVPWHVCENDRCGRLFKHQREFEPMSGKRFRTSKFCSNSCRVSAHNFARRISLPE